MRRGLLIAIPLAAVAAAVAAFVVLGPGTDPIAAARKRMARHDMKGAALYLRDAVRAHPANPEAAFLLGKVDLALGNPAAAQLELTRARAHGYNQAAIVLPLGQAYLQQHLFTELLHDFTPETAPPGSKAVTLSLRAAAQLALRDLDAAAATSNRAEQLAPQDAAVELTAARVALARRDLPGAAKRVSQVLAAEAATPSAAASNIDENVHADALLLQGEIALRGEDAKAALADAHDVLAQSPTRLDAKLMEARALAALGQETEARKAAEAVLRRAPKDIPANYLRAMLAIHAGDFAAADASLQQVSGVIADLPRAFYFLAVTKLGLQQLAQAEEAATQFLSQSPDDMSGLKLMVFIDLARRHPDRALALLQTSALASHVDADTLDLRGRALAMSGDLKGARDSFAKAAALHPGDANILNRLAAAEMDLGNISAGENDLKHSLAVSPNQSLAGAAIVQADLARGDLAAAEQDIAQLRHAGGDTEAVGVLDAQLKLARLDMAGAQAELEDVRSRFPDSRNATLSLVKLYSLSGDAAKAQSLLEAAVKKHPTDAGLLSMLLPALFTQNQTAKAVALAQAAYDAAPSNPALAAALADAYEHARQIDRAIGLLDRASAGTNAELDLVRARMLAQEGKTQPALALFQSVLDRAPGDVRIRGMLAALQTNTGQFDAARATLRDGLKLAPGNPALLDELIGVDLKQSGTGKAGVKAALATAAALRSIPANLPAANALAGKIYLGTGDVRAASVAFLAAYKAAPSGELAIKSAGTLTTAGNIAQGIAVLENWTASHPKDETAQMALSALYLEAGRLPQAAKLLEAVLAIDNANAEALNNLAWIEQQQGNTAQAKLFAERAYFQSPRPEIADTLGWILAKEGDTAQATSLLKQASSGAPSAAADYHYGVALAAAGQREAARAEVQAALAMKANFRERDDAQKFLGTLQ